MKRKPPPQPLTLYQYARIYKVIQGLSARFTKNVGRECVLFSVLGAALMHKHYRKDAKVICGLGAVIVHEAELPFLLHWFEKDDQGRCVATRETFHAWVECDGWVIDFMAPNYHEALQTSPSFTSLGVPTIPRKMFQKRVEQVEGDLEGLTRVGQAVFYGDQEVTTAVIDKAFEKPQMDDVIGIAFAWHRPLPSSMETSMTITDDLGKLSTLQLARRELVGAW